MSLDSPMAHQRVVSPASSRLARVFANKLYYVRILIRPLSFRERRGKLWTLELFLLEREGSRRWDPVTGITGTTPRNRNASNDVKKKINKILHNFS